jgi:hypothetical protein
MQVPDNMGKPKMGLRSYTGHIGKSWPSDFRYKRRQHPKGTWRQSRTGSEATNDMEEYPPSPLGGLGIRRLHDDRNLDQEWVAHHLPSLFYGIGNTL